MGLGGVLKKAGPYIGAAAGAAIGGAVGGPGGAVLGAKIGFGGGKAASGIAKSKEHKGGGFSVPPAVRSFADAGGENRAHAKSKYGFPGS